MFFIRRGIEAVITGLTRNQFVPKAHEGSNPSLCARRFNLTHSGWIEPFFLAQRKWILTMRRSRRVRIRGAYLRREEHKAVHCTQRNDLYKHFPEQHTPPSAPINERSGFSDRLFIFTVGRSRTLHRKVRGYSYVSVVHDTLRWIRHPYSRMLHTAGTEQTASRRVPAVSASRGDVCLNLY